MRFSLKDLPPHTPLVDAHLHLIDAKGINDLISAGIVAARDAGANKNFAQDQRRPQKGRGAPIIIWSGWALYKPGGYGSRIGIPVSGVNAIKREIRRLKAAGADIIKVIASGIVSLKQPGTITAGGYTDYELKLIVQEASDLGLPVMAHANGEQAILSCALAGVRSIEHGFFMTRRAADIMANRGTYWIPTVGALVRAGQANGVSQEARDFVLHLVKEHMEMIAYARSIGVPLAVGTDCVLPSPDYAAVYEAELGYFMQAGLSSDEIREIAGENGIKLLGLDRLHTDICTPSRT